MKHIYIYTYRERERERERDKGKERNGLSIQRKKPKTPQRERQFLLQKGMVEGEMFQDLVKSLTAQYSIDEASSSKLSRKHPHPP